MLSKIAERDNETHSKITESKVKIRSRKKIDLREYISINIQFGPDKLSKGWNIKEFEKRQFYCSNFSWAFITIKELRILSKIIGDKSVLSIGSGYAFIEKGLQLLGVNIIPTDSYVHPMTNIVYTWTDVEVLNHKEALAKYNTDILYMSWPTYDDPYAFESLKLFKGNLLIYIGEPQDGCTANDDFYDLLEKEWNCKEEIKITNWNSIHDSIFIYERKC